MNDVTRILEAVKAGDKAAAEELLPATYRELRSIAARLMAGERAGHTLQPTALIHEAYLKLTDDEGQLPDWDCRGHFFSAAAEAMRRILVDHARTRLRAKRGGDVTRIPFDDIEVPDPLGKDDGPAPDEVIAVDEALAAFSAVDPERAELVKLRYFAGLTIAEAAAAMGISESTANRHWTYAKGWLGQKIKDGRAHQD